MAEKGASELIHNDSENSIVGLEPETEKELGIIKQLREANIIQATGGLDNYTSMVLLDIIQNAMAPDNKGELHIDFRTKLRGLELLLKLQNNTFGKGNDVNVNFFASPKTLKH